MPAPSRILDLVNRFKEHSADYHSGKYNETQLRRDFLDPFFAELGWDMVNSAGNSEQAREVIMEYSLKMEGRNKVPDYCFRFAGIDRFFVEAKKPSINLKNDTRSAFQTRTYGWIKSLPFCILTDFEEFAVYSCLSKPMITESAQTARPFYYSYLDYEEKWDEIAQLFSYDSVQKGSLEIRSSQLDKKGALAFDDDFLKLIEGWRVRLARDIIRNNSSLQLSQSDLNFTVQMTIDRILFLRMCEDRDIEEFEQLKNAASKNGVYTELIEIFRQADNRFNSGLFHFTKYKSDKKGIDNLTLNLKISDDILHDIISTLYLPHPYNFRVMSPEILGQVYEQFLGKVIKLQNHTAILEQKPEVRKANGVFYTPTYVVDYIVEQTIGKVCLGKSPSQVKLLRVLDPACGSGSFLIGAYRYLLNWHLEFYLNHEPEKLAARRNPVIFRTQHPQYEDASVTWRLTVNEKKRVLLSMIHGVDIDLQAVEVTKLSLLLTMLEDESRQTLPSSQIQLLPSQERLLPNLDDNIKCGNSLIDHDFYNIESNSMLSVEETTKINAFRWKDEFPQIITEGGFDVIIGNPPYSNYSSRDSMRAFYERNSMPQELDLLERSINYCSIRFPEYSSGCKDLYKWFTNQALTLLNAKGSFGFIIPNTWFNQPKYADMKSQVFSTTGCIEFVDLGFGIFKVTVPTSILIARKGEESKILHADIKKIVDKKRVLNRSLSLSELNEDGSTSKNPIVAKFLSSWPDDQRLISFFSQSERSGVI